MARAGARPSIGLRTRLPCPHTRRYTTQMHCQRRHGQDRSLLVFSTKAVRADAGLLTHPCSAIDLIGLDWSLLRRVGWLWAPNGRCVTASLRVRLPVSVAPSAGQTLAFSSDPFWIQAIFSALPRMSIEGGGGVSAILKMGYTARFRFATTCAPEQTSRAHEIFLSAECVQLWRSG